MESVETTEDVSLVDLCIITQKRRVDNDVDLTTTADQASEPSTFHISVPRSMPLSVLWKRFAGKRDFLVLSATRPARIWCKRPDVLQINRKDRCWFRAT